MWYGDLLPEVIVGKYAEDIQHITDKNTGTGTFTHKLRFEVHDDLTDAEMDDLRSECATQTSFDAWWSNQGGTRATWYGGLSAGRKSGLRDVVLRVKP